MWRQRCTKHMAKVRTFLWTIAEVTATWALRGRKGGIP